MSSLKARPASAATGRGPQGGNALSKPAHSPGSRNPQWRKHLLRHRAQLLKEWERVFPKHDLSTLRRHSLDRFYETIERLAKENKACRARQQRNTRIPENWDEMSLDVLWEHLNSQRPTPRSTVEAVVYCVCERGAASLNEAQNIERLRRCNSTALTVINQRITKLKGNGHA